MRRVRLRHPVTGGTFEARETAIDAYRRSGWEVVSDEQTAAPSAPVLDPLPDPEPPAPDDKSESPRGRRTKKESE